MIDDIYIKIAPKQLIFLTYYRLSVIFVVLLHTTKMSWAWFTLKPNEYICMIIIIA